MTDSLSPKRAKHAFTLIELLVVIAIIVILMGLLFPVVSSVKESARKVQAKNDITQIVNSVKAYYTEYGKYPIPNANPAAADVAYGVSTSNGPFLDILRNTTSTAAGSGTNAYNPRSIVFLEAPSVKDINSPKSGVLASTGDWYDPWGTPYKIAIDGDYDNLLNGTTALPSFYKDTNFSPISTGVIGWSYGKDKVLGSPNTSSKYSNSDDVISWQ